MLNEITFKLKSISALLAFAASLSPLAAPASAAITWDVSNGILLGASSVNVSGSLYDVEFINGSYDSVFGATPLVFNSFASATVASQALLDLVFLDIELGSFDSIIGQGIHANTVNFTKGCEGNLELCRVATPYIIDEVSEMVYFSTAFNIADYAGGYDQVDYSFRGQYKSTFDTYNHTWARWSPTTVAAVPEPSTYAMIGLGLLGIMVMIRYQLIFRISLHQF